MILNNTFEALDLILDLMREKNTFKTHFSFDIHVDKTWQIPERIIDDWLLTYIAKGRGLYYIEGEAYPVQQGSLVFITNGVQHYAGESDGQLHAIGLRFAPYRDGRISTEEFNKIGLVKTLINQGDYYDLFRKIVQVDKAKEDDIKSYMTHNLIYQLFYEINSDIRGQTGKKERDYSTVISYIDSNIGGEIEIDKMAKMMQLSRNYFCAQFKEAYGMTVKHFIYQKKMEYAKYLILESGGKMIDIAYAVGYADQYIFSNQFKRYWGIAPSALRNMN